MSGEDQERFEDYLELEHYIEELQAGRVAHPPAELTPSQASIYRMAALFRSSSPEANEPRPEFAAELRARLEQELQQTPKDESLSGLGKKPQIDDRRRESKKPRGISRRARDDVFLLDPRPGPRAAMAEWVMRGSGSDSRAALSRRNACGGTPDKRQWHFVNLPPRSRRLSPNDRDVGHRFERRHPSFRASSAIA